MELLSDDLVQAGKLWEAAVADLAAAHARGASVKKVLLNRAQRMQTLEEDVDDVATELIARYQPEGPDLAFIKSCKRITLEFSRCVKNAHDILDLAARRQALDGDEKSGKKVTERAREFIETATKSLTDRDSAVARELERIRTSNNQSQEDTDASRVASSALVLRYLEGISTYAHARALLPSSAAHG